MTNNDKYRRNRIMLVRAISIAFIIFAIVAIVLAILNSANEKVLIDGLDQCAIELRGDNRESIYKDVYVFVKEQNNINGVKTKKTYKAVVRENSCDNKTLTIEGQGFRVANFIIDIDELKYSYRAYYTYIPTTATKLKEAEVGTEPISLYCLSSDEMIYPDFGCGKNTQINEMPDPITYSRGKVFEGCTISYTSSGTSKSGYAIILKYKPNGEEYSTFRPRCREAAMEHIKSVGANPDDYYLYEIDE